MAHDASHAPHASAGFNELDPHGSGAHSSHVIVGPMQLRLVLAVLLVFTVLTVGFAQAEQWAANYFDITLPAWINITGAMIIATIKALLVMAVFMQLKYDNPINTLIMGVTFAALAIFIAFTGLDLFNRSKIYQFKAGPIVAGGTGDQVATANGKPIVVAAKERYLARLREQVLAMHPDLSDPARAEDLDKKVKALYAANKSVIKHDHHAHHEVAGNTPSRSRPVRGLTDALSTATHDGHTH